MSREKTTTAIEQLAPMIHLIRGKRVMMDADLAQVYGVPTKRLNEGVKRNRERFPEDFVFQLTTSEAGDWHRLRSQFATLKRGQHLKYRPHAFTEHGAIMAANVLRSRQALQMSVFVVRAFVRLREVLATNAQLAQKLAELEHKVTGHDEAIQQLFKAIRQLLSQPEPPRKQIGFHVRERAAKYRVRTNHNPP